MAVKSAAPIRNHFLSAGFGADNTYAGAMELSTRSSRAVRFGVFEVDLRAGELRKNGLKVKLQEQPFQILAMLLERPGEVVTREEVQKRLWKDDTFVDFDHGLGTAVKKLREALGDSAANPRFVETLPRRGFRFIYPVKPVDRSPALPLVEEGVEEKPGATTPSVTEPVEKKPDEVPEALLSWVRGLYLAGQSFAAHPKSESLKRSVGPLGRLAKGIGKAIQALVSLVFAFAISGVMIFVLLTAMGEGKQIRKGIVQISRSIANQIKFFLPREQRIRAAEAIRKGSEFFEQSIEIGHSLEPDAFDSYQEGLSLLNRLNEEDLERAARLFERAADQEPAYAYAYAGLADSFSLLGLYGALPPEEAFARAKREAAKAAETGENLAATHASLALVKMLYEWDWRGAEEEFRISLSLNPNSAAARYRYAVYLAAMGRQEQAVEESNRARVLQPDSALEAARAGSVFYKAGRYDEAIIEFGFALETDAVFSMALLYSGMAHCEISEFEKALAQCDELSRLQKRSPFLLARMGTIYAKSGRRAEAEKLLGELNDLSKRRYVSPSAFARIQAGLGRSEPALEWLQKAFDQRSPDLVWLKTDPAFDPLRSDPRFQDLLRRMNFPE